MSLDLIAKAAEQRLTLAPVYSPETRDRHGEWTTAAELERAIFDFSKSGDRMRLQHQDGTAVGEIEAIFTWPWPADLPVYDGRGISKGTRRFPAGTAFAWVRWTPEAWAAVRQGRIRGLSVGGRGCGFAPTPRTNHSPRCRRARHVATSPGSHRDRSAASA